MNLIEQAMMFATQKHVLDNHQLYGDLVPYTHHLAAVEQVLLRFGFKDEELRVAAWLHDVIEDTRDKPNKVKRRIIEEKFGEPVGELVWAVTSEEGHNRAVRNAMTYPKIRAAGPLAVALKLADRIANIEFGGRGCDMYKKEHAAFRHGIYIAESPGTGITTDQVLAMQRHLDGLLK